MKKVFAIGLVLGLAGCTVTALPGVESRPTQALQQQAPASQAGNLPSCESAINGAEYEGQCKAPDGSNVNARLGDNAGPVSVH